MAKIEQYNTDNGVRFKVSGYLGIDPITGRQKNVNKRGFKTKKEAQLFLSNAMMQLEAMEYNPLQCTKTYREVYEEWFEQHKLSIKESSQNLIKAQFRIYILPVFGDKRINRITALNIQQAINDWNNTYKASQLLIGRFFSVINYAVKMDYLAKSPRDKITIPKKQRQLVDDAKKEYYTRDELETLLKELEANGKKQWYTFFRLLAFSGIRKGEALALTWQHVNFTDKTIAIKQTLALGLNNKPIIQTPKTLASERIIALDDKTISILKQWKIEQAKALLINGYNANNKSQLVFCNLGRNVLLSGQAPVEYLKSFCKKHNLPRIKIHGFRHTHASLLFESGASIKAVQVRLGHSDINTTMNVYTHVTQVTNVNTVQAFASYMNF